MASQRLFALLAFASLIGFFGIVMAWVPRLDLGFAIVLGLALAAYDAWSQLGWRRR